MISKNEAVIKFLMTCPIIQSNPLFFNFADEVDGNNHFITESDKLKRRYIDGSVLKHYTFTIACYKSVAHIALIEEDNNIIDQNMDDMAIVQSILDWIDEQADNENYPDFGENIEIEGMSTLSTDPDLDGIDTSVNPPLARYSIGVKIEYLDNNKVLWNS